MAAPQDVARNALNELLFNTGNLSSTGLPSILRLAPPTNVTKSSHAVTATVLCLNEAATIRGAGWFKWLPAGNSDGEQGDMYIVYVPCDAIELVRFTHDSSIAREVTYIKQEILIQNEYFRVAEPYRTRDFLAHRYIPGAIEGILMPITYKYINVVDQGFEVVIANVNDPTLPAVLIVCTPLGTLVARLSGWKDASFNDGLQYIFRSPGNPNLDPSVVAKVQSFIDKHTLPNNNTDARVLYDRLSKMFNDEMHKFFTGGAQSGLLCDKDGFEEDIVKKAAAKQGN
jgi:hypothetical protein